MVVTGLNKYSKPERLPLAIRASLLQTRSPALSYSCHFPIRDSRNSLGRKPSIETMV